MKRYVIIVPNAFTIEAESFKDAQEIASLANHLINDQLETVAPINMYLGYVNAPKGKVIHVQKGEP